MELGQVLKQTREEKKITLDELQEITKIQKRYLQAIEDGNYNILPGDFYVRAFIKQYADAIGLNHDEIMESYKHEVPQPPSHDEQQEESLSRVKKQKEAMPKKTAKIFDYTPQIIIGTVIVAIAVVLWFVWPVNNKNNIQSPQSNNAAEVDKSQDSAVNKEDEGKTEESTNKEEATTEESPKVETPAQVVKVVDTNGKVSTLELSGNEAFNLEIICKGESYVAVSNEKGVSYFAGIMKNGETQTFDLTTEEQITINAGRSLDVELKINGEATEFPQNVNDYIHQIVTIKNLRSETQGSSS